MPGPVSDSYDPEFGTGENCRLVTEQIEELRDRVGALLRSPVRNIVEVVKGPPGRIFPGMHFTDLELRVLRFALNRAIESM